VPTEILNSQSLFQFTLRFFGRKLSHTP
jgi:hypothetical protein